MPIVDLALLYGPKGPHPKQLEAHTSNARTVVLKWARRGGKGRTAVNKLIDTYFAVAEGPTRPFSLIPPFHAGFVAPFTRNADQAWMELKAFVPRNLIQRITEDEHKIILKAHGNLPWGLIEFRTADNPGSLQGWGLDFCWVTEAQSIDQDAYVILRPALRSPGRLGLFFVEGIPPLDPEHWMNILFRRGEEGEPGYFSSRLTYLENPMLSDEDRHEIEIDKETMSDAEWRRMYLAEDPSGSDAHMDFERVFTRRIDWNAQQPVTGHVYDAGLDLGKLASSTVLTIWDRTEMPWRMVYFLRMTGTDWVEQKNAIVQASTYWMARRLRMDAQGPGNPFYDELSYMGLPVEKIPIQGGTRDNLLNKVYIALEKRAISIPREEIIAREGKAMRRVSISVLHHRWQTRKGMTDDTIFSIALALVDMPLREGPAPQRKPPDFYMVRWR